MLTCPRCSRAGDSLETIRSTCADASAGIIPCPAPREVVPGRDVVLMCRKDECGRVYAFPADRIPVKQIPADVTCPFSSCEIVAIQPLVASQPSKAASGKAPSKPAKG